ncbi:uncharacterized protein Z518_06509 [Rhinocladiella mackenziei CBS 650.93]|uniref:Uncharacterized protein n=1 Tax=Rhinocladiella mackenziei CBS 650.93 TaxID=1442369 RepID=A0A0D2IAV3_9EURO|nr:uncharacterized protein Z518_06509 [Rhinocladiella mackenziei CBS 650.93]KIX02959.1 hypothetical protein Z518_06509 [Rhinocladiella mackenziei CBS 650.93]
MYLVAAPMPFKGNMIAQAALCQRPSRNGLRASIPEERSGGFLAPRKVILRHTEWEDPQQGSPGHEKKRGSETISGPDLTAQSKAFDLRWRKEEKDDPTATLSK